jgi:phosphatidylserine decarboxylase
MTIQRVQRRLQVRALHCNDTTHTHARAQTAAFVAFHKLNMAEFAESDASKYATFNEFFYRKLKPGQCVCASVQW